MPAYHLKWNRARWANIFISVYYIIKGFFFCGGGQEEESSSNEEANEVRHILVAIQNLLHKDMVLQKSEYVLLNKNINYVVFTGTEQCRVITQNVLCVMIFLLLPSWICTKTTAMEIRAWEFGMAKINGHYFFKNHDINLKHFTLTRKY